jgi:restriction system protein
MAIPTYQKLMHPLLQLASDGLEHSSRDAVAILEKNFSLTSKEKAALMPSGKSPIFYIRVHWALSYLRHAHLLERTRTGHFRITRSGLQILERKNLKLDKKFLLQFPDFKKFDNKNR